MLNSVMSALDGFRNKAQLVEAKTYTRLVFEGIEIDVSKRLVYRDKREINVTCIEFEILYLLARNPVECSVKSKFMILSGKNHIPMITTSL